MATGRPVSLKYDWFQQQTYTGKRSPWCVRVKLAADKEGKLMALESDWTVDHGPYSEFGDLLTIQGAEIIADAVGSEHTGRGPDSLHKSRLGFRLQGLRLTSE